MENLAKIQLSVFGEFSDLTSLLWILVVQACVWIATSFQKTSDARVPCLLVSALPLLIDNILGKEITRALVLGLIVIKLYHAKVSYIDYAKLSYHRLDEFQK